MMKVTGRIGVYRADQRLGFVVNANFLNQRFGRLHGRRRGQLATPAPSLLPAASVESAVPALASCSGRHVDGLLFEIV